MIPSANMSIITYITFKGIRNFEFLGHNSNLEQSMLIESSVESLVLCHNWLLMTQSSCPLDMMYQSSFRAIYKLDVARGNVMSRQGFLLIISNLIIFVICNRSGAPASKSAGFACWREVTYFHLT